MILHVLPPTHQFLHKVCKPVSLPKLGTKKMQNLIETMLDFVYGRNNKGKNRNQNKPMTVGLSANQIGILKRISIVDLAIGKKDINDIHVLINPRIIRHSRTIFNHHEGCVNLKGIWGRIKRYRKVIVKAYDRSGNKLTIEAKGWCSVLLQHEIDHLNGYLFIDHLDDPTKAHRVNESETQKYRDTSAHWKEFVDVSSLVRKS